MSDGPQTNEEAKQLFRDAVAAAEAKLPRSVAAMLTPDLRALAERTDFESALGAMIGRSWHQCAVDLIAMPPVVSPGEQP